MRVPPLAGPPRHPEDFHPLDNACFQNPYRFYRMLRDDYPVYRLSNGVYCISRYQDIVDLSRNVEVFSSEHQGVVATSDPPLHTGERKVGHSCLNVHAVKQLEPEVETLCRQMLQPSVRFSSC